MIRKSARLDQLRRTSRRSDAPVKKVDLVDAE
jgi:hypothetical protein